MIDKECDERADMCRASPRKPTEKQSDWKQLADVVFNKVNN